MTSALFIFGGNYRIGTKKEPARPHEPRGASVVGGGNLVHSDSNGSCHRFLHSGVKRKVLTERVARIHGDV